MTITADYASASDARSHLKDVLDAALRGRSVTVRRDDDVVAVVEVERLREYFHGTVSPRIRLLMEDGKAVALMEGRAFASEGIDVEAALADLVVQLREYASDWEARLHAVPNHAGNWALVQLVALSSDSQLLDWFEHGGE